MTIFLAKKTEEAKSKPADAPAGGHPSTNQVSDDSDEERPENMEDFDTRSEASSSSFDSQSSISSNDEKEGKGKLSSQGKSKKSTSSAKTGERRKI